MVVGEHAADLVELADDGLALESAASGRVPGTEHLYGALQGLDLLGADRCGLVAVVARWVGLESVPEVPGLLGQGGVGVQPVVHGVAEGGAGGEHRSRAHQTATVEHEVHSREFGEDRGCAFGRPGHPVGVLTSPVRLPSGGAPLPYEPEVLDGHDTTEPLGEQCCQYRGHRFAGASPMSIQRRTREVSVASWGWPMAAACLFTILASSPFDQPARPNRSFKRVFGPLLTSSPQVLG